MSCHYFYRVICSYLLEFPWHQERVVSTDAPNLTVFFYICVNHVRVSVCARQVESKVCGTDGITYLNECLLKVASCHKQQFVTVASSGDCGKCLYPSASFCPP